MEPSRYTEDAKTTFLRGKELALKHGHKHIEVEHLLLAMIENKNVASALSALRVDTGGLRRDLEKTLTAFPIVKGVDPIFANRLLRVANATEELATKRKISSIDTPVLLFGLIDDKTDKVGQALVGLNITKPRLEEVLFQSVSASSGKAGFSFKDGSALKSYTVDLTEQAHRGLLGPIIGRDNEIARVIQVLMRSGRNNPVLVGAPGVGRASIVQALACQIARGDVPENLKNKRILILNLGSMLAGATLRGQFEERVKALMDEVKAHRQNLILFVDEIHTIVGTGGEGASDASNLLKPALSRGEVQLMGSTTPDEYRNSIEKDKALDRRFEAIMVNEPTSAEAIRILRGLKTKYETIHRVKIEDPALIAAVELSKRYLPAKHLPEKAISLIDDACVRLRIISETGVPPEVDRAWRSYEMLKAERLAVSGDKHPHSKEEVEKMSGLEKVAQEKFNQEEAAWLKVRTLPRAVNEELINKVVSDLTGIPITRMTTSEKERLLKMEEILGERVVGQKEAIAAVSEAVRRVRAGFGETKGISFFMCGSSGTGKTELAKSLAEFLFDSDQALTRLDMSEFSAEHTVARLIGSPPGYQGSEQGGQLTEAVRHKPYQVVLLDEIERAHPNLFNILLQVLDEGRLSDSTGRLVDFKNTVIIMTSNVGSPILLESAMTHGFADDKAQERVMGEIHKTFRPEFLGRLDGIVMFQSLNKESVSAIADIQLRRVAKMLTAKKMKLNVSLAAKEFLIEKGFQPAFGARPLKTAIQKHIQTPLSIHILNDVFHESDTILVDLDGDKLSFKKQ